MLRMPETIANQILHLQHIMAIDTFPGSDAFPQTQQSSRKRNPTPPAEPNRAKRGLLLLCLLAGLATAAGLMIGAMRPKETGPRLTHVVTSGDLFVIVTEQGSLESAENTEIKCKVRGQNTVIWVVDSGTYVEQGDVLLRLDSLFIEEQIDERTKYSNWSRSAAEHSKARVSIAALALNEYEQGRFITELMAAEKDVVLAVSNLGTAKNILSHTQRMAESGYRSELDLEEKQFAVAQAKLDVNLKRTRLDVLKRFSKEEQLQTLRGDLKATKATHEANAERATADDSRRQRAADERQHCVVKAPRAGLVIHPNAAQWESQPIAEGSTIWKDKVLLLMPDLSKMQVKVGIHESVVDRVKEGRSAKVTLHDRELDGTVSSVASVTRPSGWWTGNEVRYDTLIELPPIDGLRPGMSAEVEVLIAKYKDVLTVPVAAIVETADGNFCWVKTAAGNERRKIVLGDSNDVFTIVEEGLQEGAEVILNPLVFDPAQTATTSSDESLAKFDAKPSSSQRD